MLLLEGDLLLERDRWPMMERLKQATHEYAPPPPLQAISRVHSLRVTLRFMCNMYVAVIFSIYCLTPDISQVPVRACRCTLVYGLFHIFHIQRMTCFSWGVNVDHFNNAFFFYCGIRSFLRDWSLQCHHCHDYAKKCGNNSNQSVFTPPTPKLVCYQE